MLNCCGFLFNMIFANFPVNRYKGKNMGLGVGWLWTNLRLAVGS